MRHELDRIFTEQGYVLRPALEVFHHHTVLALVTAGLGVGMLPRLLCPAEPKGLRVIKISGPKVTRAIGVIVRRGIKLTSAASRLIDMFKSHAKNAHCSLY